MGSLKKADKPGYEVTINHVDNMKIAMKFNCKADGFIEQHRLRYLITTNGIRIEVPCDKYIFHFSDKRNDAVIKGENKNV